MYALSHIIFGVDIIYVVELSIRDWPPFPFAVILMIKRDCLQNHIDELDIEWLDECGSQRVVCFQFMILFEDGDAEDLEELLLDQEEQVRLEESDAREKQASYDSWEDRESLNLFDPFDYLLVGFLEPQQVQPIYGINEEAHPHHQVHDHVRNLLFDEHHADLWLHSLSAKSFPSEVARVEGDQEVGEDLDHLEDATHMVFSAGDLLGPIVHKRSKVSIGIDDLTHSVGLLTTQELLIEYPASVYTS